MRNLLLFSGIVLTAVACGSGGGGSSSSSSSKALWSTWTSSNDELVLNLNGGQFNDTQGFYLIVEPSGAECLCQFNASGSNSSGSYSLTGCAYSSGGSGDPGCATLDQTGTFTNNGTNLTACTTGNACTTYH